MTTLPAAPGSARNWTIFRDDLLALLDRIAPHRAILAGHSMGATVSLMAAVARPDRVRALVLAEPVLIPAKARLTALLARVVGRDRPDLADRAAKRRGTFASFEAALAAYRGRGAFKTWPEETVADYLKGGLAPATDGVRLCCTPSWEAETFRGTPSGAARLARMVRCPVTLIRAADGTASASEVAAFARAHPATRVVKRRGASHFLPMEFPELVREEILRIAKTA